MLVLDRLQITDAQRLDRKEHYITRYRKECAVKSVNSNIRRANNKSRFESDPSQTNKSGIAEQQRR
jgi:hypothetical protein